MVKTGAKATGAATGAIIGASLGIASGDIKNVRNYTALGASAGNSIGAGVGNAVNSSATKIKNTVKKGNEEYKKAKYGDKYSQYEKNEQDRKFIEDKEIRRFYAQQCYSELKDLKGKEKTNKLNEIMEEAVQYRREGVTDNSIIVKARKLNKNNSTAAESKLAAVMATKADNLDVMQRYQERIAKQLGDEKASKIADNAAKLKGFY